MGAIKNKNNRNDVYSVNTVADGRTAKSKDCALVASQLEDPLHRIEETTETASMQLDVGKSSEEVLASLKKLADECERCRAILFRAIKDS